MARVSVATAGRAIGNYGSVSENTKKRVLKAASTLNFVPNINAKEIRSGSARAIAVVVANMRNSFFANIICEIEKVARDNQYNILIFNTRDKQQLELQCLEMLYARQVDGIIIASCFNDYNNIPVQKRYLYKTSLPMVYIDREIKGLDKNQVQSEQFQGAYEATKYLIELGHRAIAVIGIIKDAGGMTTTVQERISGYKMALKEAEIPFSKQRVLCVDLDNAQLSKSLATIFYKKYQNTAVLILNNSLCIPVLMEMKRKRLKYPDDISLIDWDDDEVNVLLGITTVDQQVKYIGRLAVQRIFELVENQEKEDEKGKIRITLKTHLIIRESCKKNC